MKRLISLSAACLLAGCAPSSPPPPTAPLEAPSEIPDDVIQVMVLGTYHFGNPGQDVHNMEAQSVLTEARQEELGVLSQSLQEFEPTLIAVESITEPPEYRHPGFEDFTPEQLEKVPNESIQIGFRLANMMGHDRVVGIDEQPDETEPDYFPFGKLMAHVEATGQTDTFGALNEEIGREVQAQSARQATASIPELLLEANTGRLSGGDFYYEMLKLDVGESQPGSELNAYYFMRNAKIFAKLLDVASPGDRVLVVYGAGHLHWLEHLAHNTPGVTVVEPDAYLRKAIEALITQPTS